MFENVNLRNFVKGLFQQKDSEEVLKSTEQQAAMETAGLSQNEISGSVFDLNKGDGNINKESNHATLTVDLADGFYNDNTGAPVSQRRRFRRDAYGRRVRWC